MRDYNDSVLSRAFLDPRISVIFTSQADGKYVQGTESVYERDASRPSSLPS